MSGEQNRIYPYPKTSCSCYKCERKDFTFPPSKGVPTNLSVRDCTVSDYYNCFNRRVIAEGKDQPVVQSGIELINPEINSMNYSTSFQRVDCNNCDGCPVPQYASWDPRLWSATHNQYTTFAHPPVDHTPKLKDIYSEELRGYGQNYRTYSDIDGGDIMYYTDKSREDAYYDPLFAHKAKVSKVVYKDPMGAMKPEYPREVEYENPMTSDSCDNSPYCLSFIKDTQMHREDILASNMVKINQQRWEPRWS